MTTAEVTTSAFRPGSFSNAILDPPSGHKKKRMVQSVVSIVVHTGVLAALVILPLLITNGLTLQQLDRTILIAPPPPAAPAPPRPIAVRTAAAPKFTASNTKLSVPTIIPKKIEMAAPEVASAPSIQSAAGVFGGLGSVLGGEGTAAPPPPPPAAAAGPKKPILISGDMKPPVLLYAPALQYPAIAKAARVSGIVVVMAIIDEHGNVVEAHAVSGPSLLMPEALSSVQKRRYQPTILDGEPTPIQLRVEVTFHLAT
jgi:periplasmic protein TonB